MSKESKEKNVELCAIPKEFATKKLNEIVNDPTKKVILEEYFMWIEILKSTVSVTVDDKGEVVK